MNITRPSLPASGPCTRADFNNLNDVLVELEESDLADFEVGVNNPNLLRNADLSGWERGAGPVACPVTIKTELADDWWVRVQYDSAIPGSPSPPIEATYQRETVSGDEVQIYRARFGYSAGASNEFGDIEFGQNLPARLSAAGADEGFSLALDVENQTGGAFNPKARIYACNALDDFSATTVVATVAGVPESGSSTLGNGERRVFQFRFTAGALAGATRNGLEVALVIPEAVSTGGYVRVYGVAKLEVGQTSTARVAERDSGSDSTGAGSSGAVVEALLNGDFHPGLFAADGGNVSCGIGETKAALGWTLVNTAGTLTTSRDLSNVPTTDSGASLKLTGAATATAAVAVRQKIYRDQAVLLRRALVWQAQIRNGTGGGLTPSLVIRTCATPNDFGNLTTQLTQTLTNIADGDWLRESHVLDADAITDWENGATIELTFPANSLDGTGKTVRIAQASLAPGEDDSAEWTRPPQLPTPTAGTVRNFYAEQTGTANLVTITASEATLAGLDGTTRKYGAVSTTVDLDLSGVGGLDTGAKAGATEYFLWLLGNDDGVVATYSLSGSLPTGMEAYPWKKVAGSIYTQGGSDLPKFIQRDRWVYVEGDFDIGPGALTADDNWHEATMSNLPLTAIRVRGICGTATASKDLQMAFATYASGAAGDGVGVVLLNLGRAGTAWSPPNVTPTYVVAAAFEVGIKSPGKIWYAAKSGTGATFTFGVQAYELPVW